MSDSTPLQTFDSDTMERIVPDALQRRAGATGSDTLRFHMQRYEQAARHARSGRLLDIACGVGYGCDLIARQRADVIELVGVDRDESAIEYARRRYGNERTTFVVSDAMSFRDGQGFDTIVSLETLEHVPDAAALVKTLAAQLRPEGRMICSAPVTPSVDANPHHLRDFTKRSFRRMFEAAGLSPVDEFEQVQSYTLAEVMHPTESRMQAARSNLLRYYLSHPASALRRAWSTAVDGLNNKYLTVVYQKA